MMPATKNGLPALECVSAMQKCIRRGLEREAMEFCVELLHTSKAYCSMAANRLEVIAHEDIDAIAQPWIIPFVMTCAEQAKQWHELPNPGKSRMALGNCIRMMARAAKSREADHFQCAVGLRALLENYVPETPDFALDQHTAQGKRMGRGLDHFLSEGAKLVPAPTTKDPYEAEAHRLWRLKAAQRLL